MTAVAPVAVGTPGNDVGHTHRDGLGAPGTTVGLVGRRAGDPTRYPLPVGAVLTPLAAGDTQHEGVLVGDARGGLLPPGGLTSGRVSARAHPSRVEEVDQWRPPPLSLWTAVVPHNGGRRPGAGRRPPLVFTRGADGVGRVQPWQAQPPPCPWPSPSASGRRSTSSGAGAEMVVRLYSLIAMRVATTGVAPRSASSSVGPLG